LHPNCTGLFIFDQSSNHNANPEDGLIAKNLNLSDGGKNVPKLRDGWFIRDGQRVVQKMQTSDGVQKGIKTILAERGLWPANSLRLDCPNECSPSSDCCARKLLSTQPDFIEQRSAIQEVVEKNGHIFDMYPKFHCELNFIERIWGEAKRTTRAECEYSFASLKDRVPQILKNVPIIHIRKYSRKSQRYLHAYSKGLTGKVAEWVVKRYKSHRRIPDGIEEEIEKEFGKNE